jgi:hypothetical protein
MIKTFTCLQSEVNYGEERANTSSINYPLTDRKPERPGKAFAQQSPPLHTHTSYSELRKVTSALSPPTDHPTSLFGKKRKKRDPTTKNNLPNQPPTENAITNLRM